jgi:AcrR family transcriptional regulator
VGWLLASAGFASFPVEAVARAAGVSSMTVCSQFSKADLLEAVSAGWPQHGRVRSPAEAASQRGADRGLALFVRAGAARYGHQTGSCSAGCGAALLMFAVFPAIWARRPARLARRCSLAKRGMISPETGQNHQMGTNRPTPCRPIMRSAGPGWPPLMDRHGRLIDDTGWVPPSHGHAW